MSKQTKTFENMIIELVNRFSYQDFQPPTDKAMLKNKIYEIICGETAYWTPLPLDPRNDWCGVNLRSFKNWEDYMVSFLVGRDSLRLYLSNGLDGFQHSKYSVISLKTAWLSHESLANFLILNLKNCIDYANREKHEDVLKWADEVESAY